MAQTMAQRLTDAIMKEAQSGTAGQSASLGTADEEQTKRLKQAVKDGVLEGLEEHDRRIEQQGHGGSDSSSSSGGMGGKLLGSVVLLAVMALLRRRMQGGSGSGGSGR